jgi:DNA polymerase IIIc chi subunit
MNNTNINKNIDSITLYNAYKSNTQTFESLLEKAKDKINAQIIKELLKKEDANIIKILLNHYDIQKLIKSVEYYNKDKNIVTLIINNLEVSKYTDIINYINHDDELFKLYLSKVNNLKECTILFNLIELIEYDVKYNYTAKKKLINIAIKQGADPKIKLENGNTIIHYLVTLYTRYDEDFYKFIIVLDPTNLSVKNNDDQTPLELAIKLNKDELTKLVINETINAIEKNNYDNLIHFIKYILDDSSLFKLYLTKINDIEKCTILFDLIEYNKFNLIKIAFNKGANPKILKDGNTIIHSLIFYNFDFNFYKYIIDLDHTNLSVKNKDNQTPLELAIKSNKDELTKLLINIKINTIEKTNYKNLIHFIKYILDDSSLDNSSLFKLYLTKISDITECTILFDLIEYNKIDLLYKIYLINRAIEKGANPKILKDGNTIIHSLIFYNFNFDFVEFIIDLYPANLRVKNNDKQTPIDLAIKNKNKNIINYIIKTGYEFPEFRKKCTDFFKTVLNKDTCSKNSNSKNSNSKIFNDFNNFFDKMLDKCVDNQISDISNDYNYNLEKYDGNTNLKFKFNETDIMETFLSILPLKNIPINYYNFYITEEGKDGVGQGVLATYITTVTQKLKDDLFIKNEQNSYNVKNIDFTNLENDHYKLKLVAFGYLMALKFANNDKFDFDLSLLLLHYCIYKTKEDDLSYIYLLLNEDNSSLLSLFNMIKYTNSNNSTNVIKDTFKDLEFFKKDPNVMALNGKIYPVSSNSYNINTNSNINSIKYKHILNKTSKNDIIESPEENSNIEINKTNYIDFIKNKVYYDHIFESTKYIMYGFNKTVDIGNILQKNNYHALTLRKNICQSKIDIEKFLKKIEFADKIVDKVPFKIPEIIQQNFIEILTDFAKEESQINLKKLLYFWSAKITFNEDMNYQVVINEKPNSDKQYLEAHTCFYQLVIPNIEDIDELRQRILDSFDYVESGLGLV